MWLVIFCIQTMAWLPMLGILLTCARLLKHANALEGCANTARESALTINSWGKLPNRITPGSRSSLCQHRAGPDARLTELHRLPQPPKSL